MHARQLINSAQGVVTLGAVELADPGPGTERAACLGLPGTARRWPVAGYSSVGEVVGAGPGVEIAPTAGALCQRDKRLANLRLSGEVARPSPTSPPGRDSASPSIR